MTNNGYTEYLTWISLKIGISWIFSRGQNLLEFSDRFKMDADCKEYLADLKNKDGYKYLKCGHGGHQKRKDFSRACNLCSHIESATANTLFHRVKFGLRKAFFICFEMTTSIKSL